MATTDIGIPPRPGMLPGGTVGGTVGGLGGFTLGGGDGPALQDAEGQDRSGGLTAAQIREALNQGKITRQKAISLLRRHGYTAAEATLYLSLDTEASTSGGGRGRGGGRGGDGSESMSGISSSTAINQILSSHGGWRPYLPLINGLADELDVDRVYLLAAVIARRPPPKQIASFARAFANALRRFGTLEGAYHKVAPKSKRSPADLIPTRYVSGEIDLSPRLTEEQKIEQSLFRAALRDEIEDPWVVIKNGKVTFVSNRKNPGVPPKGSLKVRRSDFLEAWQNYDEMFEVMIGRRAKAGEVATIIKKGWSEFTIKDWLSKKPEFTQSAVWRSEAPGLIGIARDILGGAWESVGGGDRKELLRKAIVEGWDQATFAEKLRERPEYLQGPEFQGNVASLSSVYESIYGVPSGAAQSTIQEAALARWNGAQFGAWLRQQPGYTSSPEYQAKAMSVLESLGAVFGALPALVPGGGGGSPYPQTAPGVPDSPRIAGAPGAPQGPLAGYQPGFAGGGV